MYTDGLDDLAPPLVAEQWYAMIATEYECLQGFRNNNAWRAATCSMAENGVAVHHELGDRIKWRSLFEEICPMFPPNSRLAGHGEILQLRKTERICNLELS
jgi:hypothetical protein